MSVPMQTIPTAVSEFQAHFGTPPGDQDAKAECEKWKRLCGELLAERHRLRAQLEEARLDQICKSFKFDLTKEQVYAQVDRDGTLDEIIADLERQPRKKA